MKNKSMKTKNQFLIPFLVSLFLIFGSSCMVIHPQHRSRTMVIHEHHSGKIPPGQMKKMTGEKSAKHYAPGHAKKHKNK
jgi:hypothetical protein